MQMHRQCATMTSTSARGHSARTPPTSSATTVVHAAPSIISLVGARFSTHPITFARASAQQAGPMAGPHALRREPAIVRRTGTPQNAQGPSAPLLATLFASTRAIAPRPTALASARRVTTGPRAARRVQSHASIHLSTGTTRGRLGHAACMARARITMHSRWHATA